MSEIIIPRSTDHALLYRMKRGVASIYPAEETSTAAFKVPLLVLEKEARKDSFSVEHAAAIQTVKEIVGEGHELVCVKFDIIGWAVQWVVNSIFSVNGVKTALFSLEKQEYQVFARNRFQKPIERYYPVAYNIQNRQIKRYAV